MNRKERKEREGYAMHGISATDDESGLKGVLLALPRFGSGRKLEVMSAIIAILDPEPDGSVHLQAPEGLRHGKVKVVAAMTAADATPDKPRPKAGSLKGLWTAPDFDAPPDDFKEHME